jgi:alkyldihydroxyacetonephosphate synthase
VRVAARHGVPVTAQGGRSGVVGGAAAPNGSIALDMTGLDRIVELDDVSATVTVEAGVFGPDLERSVRSHGWTVGHYPQSFDISTVGGWIACRGAGQFSNRYGTISDMVRGLHVVLADATVVTLGDRGPRQAIGPDLMQLFIGSEGSLGVITRATLTMHPVPEREERSAVGFDSFDEGMDACRRILQRGARPAVLRLYDHAESLRHFDVEQCVLIVLDEGDPLMVHATMQVVGHECGGATRLDRELVETWLAHRNDVGALAPLWQHGVAVDTIEVAGPWARLSEMRRLVSSALMDVAGMAVASVHQSHAYLDGACLYFTFAGRPESDGDLTTFYREAWDVATNAVVGCGGAMSHHHGIGRNRARFVPSALGDAFATLQGLKAQFDPDNIMNPGVLGLGASPW